jgi:hypothetical protein
MLNQERRLQSDAQSFGQTAGAHLKVAGLGEIVLELPYRAVEQGIAACRQFKLGIDR